MASLYISGEPGETWTNDTGKIWNQAHVNFRNSCGVCISIAGKVARYWPFPLHFGCLCQNIPIAPGAESSPFIDFQERLAELGPDQQAVAVGASNWQAIQSGLVKWDDVVTRARVRDFREVVARQKLTVPELVKAGVQKVQAEKAYNAVNTDAHNAASQVRKTVADALRQHGLSDQQIAREAGVRLAQRIGIAAGPSGPSPVSSVKRRPPGYGGAAAAILLIPRTPIAPMAAHARLVEALGAEVASTIDMETIKTEADVERLIALHKQTPELYQSSQDAFGDYLGFTTPPLILHSPDREK